MWRRLLAIATVISAVGVLATATVEGFTTISDEQRTSAIHASTSLEQFQACLMTRVQKRVPRGASVVMASMPTFYVQRMTEALTPSVHIVTDRAKAQYVVAVKMSKSPRSCSGRDVVVRPT